MERVTPMETPLDSETWLEECFENVGPAKCMPSAPVTQTDTKCHEHIPHEHITNEHGPHEYRRHEHGPHEHTVIRHANAPKGNRLASKPHSTPLTLKWLEENYEIADGVCIPRSTLYVHYMDFCVKNDSQAVNAASFGKIIRQQFPNLTTRRLGTRGQSKYHYYGVAIKDTSIYYELMYSKKGVHNLSDDKRDTVKQLVAYSPRCKLGTLLPEFPKAKDLKLSPNATEDKVSTFLMMYRTHCQRILDTVIGANFDEVQSFLVHFWQGMPPHIGPILSTPLIVQLVGVCDSILYKTLSGVLMPTIVQPLPDSLTQVIDHFARLLVDWLRVALHGMPESLREIKFDLARRFAQMLKRQTSLNHLCQASRGVIYSNDITAQMLSDWSRVDIHSICKQTLYTMDMYTEREYHMVISLYEEFESLLEERASIESFIDWLHSLVDRCVVQSSMRRPGSLRRTARQFLLTWSCFGTRIIRDMTLHSAVSFGSFHLLHLMFDDYVMYLVENLYSEERANELLRSIKGETPFGDQEEEVILPDPRFTSATFNAQCSYTSPLGVAMSSTTDRRQSVITDAREWTASTGRGGYCHSPHPGSSGHSSSSPTQSYDARLDTSLTSLSSGENNLTTMISNGDPAATASDPGCQYGGYLPSMSTMGAQAALSTNDAATCYSSTYGATNNMQCGAMSRCYTNDSMTPNDWGDTQRYTQARHTAYVEGNHLNQTYYGMSRSECVAPAYTYGPENMRTSAQSSAALYGQYGYQDGYCQNGASVGHDESTYIRKRKHDDMYTTDLAPKRATSIGDYSYDMTTCYPRA